MLIIAVMLLLVPKFAFHAGTVWGASLAGLFLLLSVNREVAVQKFMRHPGNKDVYSSFSGFKKQHDNFEDYARHMVPLLPNNFRKSDAERKAGLLWDGKERKLKLSSLYGVFRNKTSEEALKEKQEKDGALAHALSFQKDESEKPRLGDKKPDGSH